MTDTGFLIEKPGTRCSLGTSYGLSHIMRSTFMRIHTAALHESSYRNYESCLPML